jgi:hypothetical protein
MEELKIKDAPPVQLKPTVESGLLEKTLTETREERQIVLHCSVFIPPFGARMRIWETTYLFDIGSPKRSKLITAFNISIHPEWSAITAGTMENFTLIFESLPKECDAFYLVEHTIDSGGFYTKPIARNSSDVYFVKISVTQD